MATPVPVVSMMYCLVSTPPNTLCMFKPAFSAMSVNQAIREDWAGACALDCWARAEVGQTTAALASSSRRQRRRGYGAGDIVPPTMEADRGGGQVEPRQSESGSQMSWELTRRAAFLISFFPAKPAR